MSIARYFNPRLRKRILAGETIGWLLRHPRYDYILRCVLATPPWADRERIKELRDRAREKTRATGEPWVLDHIVPLTHPYVCGLNVDYNLAIVPYRVNAAKGNRWHPDQTALQLVVIPEQLRLLDEPRELPLERAAVVLPAPQAHGAGVCPVGFGVEAGADIASTC